jgi:Domain of unknown function (DUF4936)
MQSPVHYHQTPVHYYVWYRLHGDATRASSAIDAVIADVFRHAGVQGRVLVRRDEPRTWMEVYEHVMDHALFEHELAAAVARHAAATYAEDGVRHSEAFIAAR